MSNNCKNCGSYAINHHLHGRDGSDPDVCDVCYWRKRSIKLRLAIQALRERVEMVLNNSFHPEYKLGMHEALRIIDEAMKK